MFKPRGDILLVEYVKEPELPATSIVLPDDDRSIMRSFKVLAVGSNVKDIKVGDTIRGEDTSQSVQRGSKVRIINATRVHLIHG